MELNKDGIFICDLFHLNYYGINVFFMVVDTKKDSVCLYEVKTKIKKINGERFEILTKRLIATDKPYIVNCLSNSERKTNYWVYPMSAPYEENEKIVLPIEVTSNSLLYQEALKRGEGYPVTGFAYAEKIDDYLNKCWKYTDRNNNFQKKYNKNIIIC